MKQFLEGYIYLLTDAPYELNLGDVAPVCNIQLEHAYLLTTSEGVLFLCNERDIDKIVVLEGVIKPTYNHFDSVGDYWSDDNTTVVICESDDRKGDTVYVTVALIY